MALSIPLSITLMHVKAHELVNNAALLHNQSQQTVRYRHWLLSLAI